MKVVKMTSEAREGTGSSGANRLRRSGRTPAVVYGEGAPPAHVTVPAHEFRMAVDAGARVIDLAGSSGEPQRVLLTEVQFDAMGTKLLHADFRRMDPAHEITLRIPVIYEGAPKGLAEGGVLTIIRDVLAVRCLPKDIPESFTVEVAGLELGESIEAGKVKLPAGVKLAEDAHDVIVGCTMPKKVEVAAPAVAEGAAAVPGAVPAAGAAPGAPGGAPAAGGAAAAPAAGGAAGGKPGAPAKDAKGGGEKKK